MGQIIAVVSGKGGVGKTTVTACLGAALSRRGHRVLLCDGDFGLRDLDLVLGKEDEVFYDASDASRDKTYTEDAVIEVTDDLDLLPASQSVRWEELGRKKYRKLIGRLADAYDYILVDAPAGIGRGVEAILEMADRCVVVTLPLWVSLRNAARMIQICREQGRRDYAVVFNSLNPDGTLPNIYDMLDTVGAEYVGAVLPYSEDVIKRTQNGALHTIGDTEFGGMLDPLTEYAETGCARDERDILDAYNEYVKKRMSSVSVAMPTLASPDTADAHEGSDGARGHGDTGGWTTQRLTLHGKQSLWRRRK